jgi:hypothetical protein
VIVPGQDQNYVRTAFSGEDLDKDRGVPQVYYCHNVMPHQEGLQSVGYREILPGVPAAVGFQQIILLRDDLDNKAFLGVRDIGGSTSFYISDGTGSPWQHKAISPSGLLTTAYVAGTHYVFLQGAGCFKYNFTAGTVEPVLLAGINYPLITGICAASGYLIAWTKGVPGISKTVTVVKGDYRITLPDTSGILMGQVVTGPGVPPDTFVAEIHLATHGGPAVVLTNPIDADGVDISMIFGASTSTVAWSSTIDPTDFVPSAISGAGGGPIEAAKGNINFCIPHTLGFIVGTADNCIAALYQSNQLFPFQFRELVNSGGMTSLDLVSWDANSSGIYAYTTSGVQLISAQQTQTVLTEITDFISGSNFEDFDDTTKTFTEVILTQPLKKKLTVVIDRYLVVSYGVNSLTHALVYDLITKRYGKLKGEHSQCFTYQIATGNILEAPRQSIGFLRTDGSVFTVDFNISSPYSNGTLLLGKYQYVRSRNLILDTITFESVRATQSFNLTLLTALDGKNTVNSIPALSYSSGLVRTYACRAEGRNHSLLLQGGFMANSLTMQFHLGGKR